MISDFRIEIGSAKSPAGDAQHARSSPRNWTPLSVSQRGRRMRPQSGGPISRELRRVEAAVWQESRLQHRAVSPEGALGVMQLAPATARDLGVDPLDLTQNISGRRTAGRGRKRADGGGRVRRDLDQLRRRRLGPAGRLRPAPGAQSAPEFINDQRGYIVCDVGRDVRNVGHQSDQGIEPSSRDPEIFGSGTISWRFAIRLAQVL